MSIENLIVQGAQGAIMVGGLYAAASVLCEVNTLEDIQTSIMVSSVETPVLLLGAAVLGYGMKSYGPPLLAVPGAAMGGAIIVGSTIAVWEHVGGFLGLHNHTADQKRKHIAGLTLAGAVCAVAGTAVNTLSVVGQVPMGIILTGDGDPLNPANWTDSNYARVLNR